MDHNIGKIRHDYNLKGLSKKDLDPDPLRQFRIWFNEAVDSGISEPNAMLLSTASNGRPSSRIVLLKDLDATGFMFFTNYHSKKGAEMANNPQVSLTFFWKEFERQVRVEGKAEKTSAETSDEYFASRPRGSQIGAWVSSQSSVIENRGVLQEQTRELEAQFADSEVPRPPHWGGYKVIPDYVEFWQGRPSRLHDRLTYTKAPDGLWSVGRLAP